MLNNLHYNCETVLNALKIIFEASLATWCSQGAAFLPYNDCLQVAGGLQLARVVVHGRMLVYAGSHKLMGKSDVKFLQGGFSGWTSSKLQTKMSNTVSAVEILAPVFGTVRKAASPSNGSRVSIFADMLLA